MTAVAFAPVSPLSPAETDASNSTCAPLAVVGRDVRVPLVTGGEAEYAALDYAASAPCLQRVWDDVSAYLPYYGSVHRGAGYLSQLSTDLYERSRTTVAEYLGTRVGDVVLFTRGTTDSLNLLASVLPSATRVFVFETEHHAALLPWRRTADVTHLAAPSSHAEAVASLDAALAADADEHGGDRPRLVCVTGASNVTGELFPVRELAQVARRHGARIVLDAAQLAPHHAVSLAELDVDWVAFSGHKLYAPFGAGVLAGRGDWLADAEPYLAGGGASRSVTADAVEWNTGPARHEAGSPNVIGAYAIASACRALSEAGLDALAAREDALLARLRAGLAGIPEVRTLDLFGPESARVSVLSFVVEGWNSSRFAAALSAEYGIGVRDGLFCAHPLVRRLLGGRADAPTECGAPDAPSGEQNLNAIRVSFGAGTPDEHVDRFVGAVRELVRRGAKWTYRTDGGRCVPESDPRGPARL
ncbi:aminotransferase class V-fold PLP-dependent enzyme [Yinghuangia sp. YIM S09857]|uniref:aminotransferase class V-fold PLP-dependent enzyme n=1 Tax=Yinghuangia sp. YIM S09857 TaxID=3436929 RepID=UPI003F52DFFC